MSGTFESGLYLALVEGDADAAWGLLHDLDGDDLRARLTPVTACSGSMTP